MEQNLNFFDELFERLDSIYARYAKRVGFHYTSLHVFCLIATSEASTQKSIAEQCYLPKQTVHSIVSSFQRQGLMELLELPEDRRHKVLRLTEKGRDCAEKILPRFDRAEERAIAQFSAEERDLVQKLIHRYLQTLSAELLG